MKKWLIGGGIVGALAVALLVGSLVTGASAQGTTPPQDTITPEEAKAAALAANPGTTAIEVELENENGAPVYEVELDNGLEVMVDASDGTILGTEQEDSDDSADDTDDVQDEVEDENEVKDADEAGDVDDVDDADDADDALETSDAQDVLGQ